MTQKAELFFMVNHLAYKKKEYMVFTTKTILIFTFQPLTYSNYNTL